VSEAEPDWRQRKKTATRDRIRASALRLFREQGYDATTVEQIAAEAGVSHMTFFRYFPAKEDVALSDSYDPLLAGLIERTPASWPVADRIRAALLQGLRQLYDADRDALLAQNTLIVSTPALRERLWASQMATQQLILQALGAGRDDPPSFTDRVTVAACLAAATTAILTWVENDGTPDLPALIDQAFAILTRPRLPLSSPPYRVVVACRRGVCRPHPCGCGLGFPDLFPQPGKGLDERPVQLLPQFGGGIGGRGPADGVPAIRAPAVGMPYQERVLEVSGQFVRFRRAPRYAHSLSSRSRDLAGFRDGYSAGVPGMCQRTGVEGSSGMCLSPSLPMLSGGVSTRSI
jgi:AcrR family transcriptional regulator